MNRRGAVLLLTFMIMVTLTLIVVYFLYMTSAQLRSAAYDVQSSKALWLAEAGIQKYMYYLKEGTYDADNHPSINENLGDGNYSLTAPSYDAGTFTYSFTSTGTVGQVSRKIAQSAIGAGAGVQAVVHGDGSHVRFDSSDGLTVNGNVSCGVSVLNEEDLANYADFVAGTYTITEDVHINPALDLPTYLALAQADDNPPGDVHVATSLTFNAGTYDGVYYATQDVIINSGVTVNGSVVAGRHVTFANGPVTVTIKPEESTRAQADGNNYVAVYAGSNISSTDTGAPKNRRGLTNSTINGLVLAGSDITLNYFDNATFNGAIIAGSNLDFYDTQTANGLSGVIAYDVGIFTPPVIGFSTSGGSVIVPQADWNEVVPAT